MIIGLLGEKQHGKTTSANYIIQKYNFLEISYADPLKKGIKEIFGLSNFQLYNDHGKEQIDLEYGVSTRQIMQFIGTDIFRNQINLLLPHIGNNFWINRLYRHIQNNPGNYIISDCRFQNEVDQIHNLGGIVIKIFNPNIISSDTHLSETNVQLIDNYDYLLINNDTLDQLYLNLDNIMDNITSSNNLNIL